MFINDQHNSHFSYKIFSMTLDLIVSYFIKVNKNAFPSKWQINFALFFCLPITNRYRIFFLRDTLTIHETLELVFSVWFLYETIQTLIRSKCIKWTKYLVGTKTFQLFNNGTQKSCKKVSKLDEGHISIYNLIQNHCWRVRSLRVWLSLRIRTTDLKFDFSFSTSSIAYLFSIED